MIFTANEIFRDFDVFLAKFKQTLITFNSRLPYFDEFVQDKNLRIDLTEIANIIRKDSHTYELNHIDTITSTLQNIHENEQQINSGEITRKYSTSLTLTTTNTITKSHQVGGGFKGSAKANIFFAKVSAELSHNYGYNWDHSSMAGTINTTTNEKTVTIPKQTITLRPYTKVNVTTEVFIQRVKVRYLIDAYIDGVGFECKDTCNYCEAYSNDCKVPFLFFIPILNESYSDNLDKLDSWPKDFNENPLFLLQIVSDNKDRMLFTPDDENLVNIVYDESSNKYILKRIPFIVDRTEIVTKTEIGKERPFYEMWG